MKKVALATLAIIVSVTSASAVPILRITDPSGPTQVIILDEQAFAPLDLAPGQLGVVAFAGSVGPNWTFVGSAGTTKPNQGSATSPFMHLNSFQISSTNGGTLIVEFSERDFGPTPPGQQLVAEVSVSISPGTALFETYADAGNTSFNPATLVASQGPFAGGAFASTIIVPAFVDPQYSLTQKVTITHTGAGVSSFDYEIRTVSVPSSLLLFSSGLIGFVIVRRRAARS